MRNFLITSDLHFTEKAIDADRWNLFPWLKEQIIKYDVNDLLLLGDLTDAKDRHPSTLVNRLVNSISELAVDMCEVHILKGNHDFIDENSPFFKFLNQITNVKFYTKPRAMGDWLFLSHTKNWQRDWEEFDFNDYKYIFCHQTFDGAKAENDSLLKGISPTVFKGYRGSIYSGDIHVPQRLGAITYVGSPYRVHFGDTFKPRVLLLRDGNEIDLHYPGKGRELCRITSLRELQEADFDSGTQIQVKVELRRSEFTEWPNLRRGIKNLITERGWESCGIRLTKLASSSRGSSQTTEISETSPEEIVSEFSVRQRLKKKMASAGLRFLQEAQNE